MGLSPPPFSPCTTPIAVPYPDPCPPFSPCTIPVAVPYTDPHPPFSPCTIPVAVPYPDPHEKWKRLVQAPISYITMRKACSGKTVLVTLSFHTTHIRNTILTEVNTQPVVIVSGMTGSGKTTQVPQFILESYIEHRMGAGCNIIVTQPRRISTISIAERVAAERGERVGVNVGYQVCVWACVCMCICVCMCVCVCVCVCV